MAARRGVPLMVAVVGLMAGCDAEVTFGSGSDPASEVEAKIVDGLAAQDLEATAECPSDMEPAKGSTYNCTATVDGQVVDIEVVFTSDTYVEVENVQALISPERVEQFIEDNQEITQAAIADCGDQEVLVVDVGDTFSCNATIAGRAASVGLVVSNSDGLVGFAQVAAQNLIGDRLTEVGIDSEVRCPADFTAGDNTMDCEATIGDQVLHYDVRLDSADLNAEPREALMDVGYLEEWVADYVDAETASCGAGPVLVAPAGATITCQVTSLGATEPVQLRVLDPEGNFEPVP